MDVRGAEPFATALGELRGRLVRGEYLPETRLAASELAAELRLSATPVREALSRLAGEGLLEDRRGQGFFVRRLGRRDIAVLYRLSLAHLQLASADADLAPLPEDGPFTDPVGRVEQLFARWMETCGPRALLQSFARIQAQLGPVRRLEPLLVSDLAEEADGLCRSADPAERAPRLRRFHLRRVRLADRLADLAERGPALPRNKIDIV